MKVRVGRWVRKSQVLLYTNGKIYLQVLMCQKVFRQRSELQVVFRCTNITEFIEEKNVNYRKGWVEMCFTSNDTNIHDPREAK